jgi:hypothetical protein
MDLDRTWAPQGNFRFRDNNQGNWRLRNNVMKYKMEQVVPALIADKQDILLASALNDEPNPEPTLNKLN